MEFPIFKTKILSDATTFSLEDPAERWSYFAHKAGPEIAFIQDYLAKGGTFVGFLLGKKNSGKGTYSKMFIEAVGGEHLKHISVGDVVRNANAEAVDSAGRSKLLDFLKRKYRGPLGVEKIIDVITGRDTATLLPTEVILSLVEREIDAPGRKAVFVDGFPRTADQVSLSLYLRALMGYRDDPDFFVFISIPNTIIDERIKNRVICPICKTPRSLKLLRTQHAGWDADKKEFYLKCDTPACGGARMVPKEGDELGIGPIRDRIALDEKIAETLLDMEGIEKILLRNAIPVAMAEEFVDSYEITPGYTYSLNPAGEVIVGQEPWSVPDDAGVESYSLLPAAVTLGLIKRTAEILGFSRSS